MIMKENMEKSGENLLIANVIITYTTIGLIRASTTIVGPLKISLHVLLDICITVNIDSIVSFYKLTTFTKK